ncbi:MAG: dihydroneopterin triphosphate diphosphatase [Gammaproteobacteria bacterium]|nr:dihydroneopterin triphosphate diphosphatase [Gammaproteobacteria bacterium]
MDPRHFKRPESVLVVVHTSTEALLIKRADHDDFWQSVTGSLCWRESPRDAALRELYEETGLRDCRLRATGITRRFEILKQWQHRYPPDCCYNTEHLFFSEINEPIQVRLNPVEHCDYQWLQFAEASEIVSSWTNRLALRSLG